MITLRRNTERRHVRRGKQDTWRTFYPPERTGPPTENFGVLATLDEIRFAPGGGSKLHPCEAVETITYVYRGALAQEDSTGNSGVVHAGEFQRATDGNGIRRKETNVSRTDQAHILRITLHPSAVGLDYAREQKHFAAAERHNTLRCVASPDGRQGSLRILPDALICSSLLDPGHHLIHELLSGRSAWLHLIHGEAIMQDIILTQGDGVGVTSEPSVSLTAHEESEILLIDMGPVPKPVGGGVAPSLRKEEA